MQIKRFRGGTLADALRDVKAELGPEALILSTKTLRTGFAKLGRSAKTVVEVVAAIDRDASRSKQAARPSAVDPSWSALSLSKSLLDPLEHEVRALRDSFEVDRPGREIARLRAELAAFREAVAEMQESLRSDDQRDAPSTAEQHLRSQGFGAELSRQLIEEAQLETNGSGDSAWGRVCDALVRRLDAAIPPPGPGDSPIEFFVGAPGVGKTTSLAKIAVRDQRHCAVLSADGERAGGAEALRQLTDETGVPFSTAWSPEQAFTRGTRMGRARLLVDTAGSSRSDRSGRAELLRLRERAGRRVTVHWVASATTREEDLRDELRRFDALRPDTMILTKADEATTLAPLARLILDPATPPLCWLGTGVHVPEGLAVPDPRRLSRRMLGGSL